jgi:hypothetical protein
MEKQLDEKFEILELINSADIDIYMKLLMLMKSGRSIEQLRADLCHTTKKYLIGNNKLINAVKFESYKDYDTSILSGVLDKINKAKIEECKLNIKNIMNQILEISNDYEMLTRIFLYLYAFLPDQKINYNHIIKEYPNINIQMIVNLMITMHRDIYKLINLMGFTPSNSEDIQNIEIIIDKNYKNKIKIHYYDIVEDHYIKLIINIPI